MDLGLAGAVVLVAGGSGYIGSAVAQQFVAEGARVIIAARDGQRLDAVAARLGASVATRVMDTASADSVSAAIDGIVAECGRLDVAVLSAAPAAQTLDPALGYDPDSILHAVDAKAMGYLRVANAVLPVMTAAGHGRLVLIDGQAALFTGNLTGSIRNRVVLTISKNLADATAGTGVTVNCVHPGTVTDNPARPLARGVSAEVTPAQVAAAVVFLASANASAISGESIAIGHRTLGFLDG